VIAVQERHASRIPGARRDKSDSGNTIFIEPEGIRGMGDELEDALNAEKAEMTRILSEITAMIAKETKPLRQTLKVLAHIDLTYAKVCFSRHFEMNPPRLNTEGLIELKGARHPLLLALQRAEQKQEIFTTEVVPIDFRLGDDFQTLIITGPNTGGKTVTLKTVGLLILMAQSGLHIPAGENSKLTICQHIFADIGDEQSLEMSLSTFSSHLKNIAEILAAADKTSLVLLDELGGGTDPAEGAALGESIIKYLHSRRVRTVVTTHISPLKNLGYTVQGIENASVQFDLETLRPTYKLLIGTPGSSNALAIAKRLGLPHRVIKEAEKGSVREDEGVSALINQLQAAKSIADENRYAAEGAKAEALRLEAEYRQKLAHLSARETEMRDQLSAEAFTELRTVKNRLDRLRHTHASAKSLLKSLDEISAELANTLNESPEEKQRLEFIETLKPGDSVLVRSLNRAGTLNRIDASGDQAVVQFGVMQMTVSLADVEIS
jgi:DNA mismatch repair protein MutS2